MRMFCFFDVFLGLILEIGKKSALRSEKGVWSLEEGDFICVLMQGRQLLFLKLGGVTCSIYLAMHPLSIMCTK
ncbi:hypothetical protein NC651_039823 [Populus alba x Populus x berolinensis]|nr:hypothetical protein NC651_039823 [Populus alba x Populus x berolinensis]